MRRLLENLWKPAPKIIAPDTSMVPLDERNSTLPKASKVKVSVVRRPSDYKNPPHIRGPGKMREYYIRSIMQKNNVSYEEAQKAFEIREEKRNKIAPSKNSRKSYAKKSRRKKGGKTHYVVGGKIVTRIISGGGGPGTGRRG